MPGEPVRRNLGFHGIRLVPVGMLVGYPRIEPAVLGLE